MEGSPQSSESRPSVSLEEILGLVTQTNHGDERGLCACPEWDARRSCGKGPGCWLHHEGRDCEPFTLLGEAGCGLGDACERAHLQGSHEYHQIDRPCIYSDEDADLLRQCNSQLEGLLSQVCLGCDEEQAEEGVAPLQDKGKEDMPQRRFHMHRLFDTQELRAFVGPLAVLGVSRSRDQIQCVCKFLVMCGARWREKVQLLELWFRMNNLNTWISCQTHIEEGTLETMEGDYLHFPVAKLVCVCWDAPEERCPFKLNVSTRPKLESVKEMLLFNESYQQNFERLTQAGMLIIDPNLSAPPPSSSSEDASDPVASHAFRGRIAELERQVEEKMAQLRQKDSQLEEFTDSQTCSVCMDLKKNTKLIPCNHVACCTACAKKVDNCPICRAVTTGYEVVYLT